MVTFGDGDYASIPKPETSKHVSFMPCVNAVGRDSTPVLVFQGKRAMSKFTAEYPDVLLGMDPAGYMSQELFVAWCKKWEAATRPTDGSPRLLLFDSHFSHLAVDGVVFLLQHNVRVLTVHPHTTHLTCVLDSGPFKRFNFFLRDEIARLSPPGTAVNDSNLAGCVRRAWQRTLVITTHRDTGLPTSPVISGFKKTGISPFSRHLLDADIFTASDHYKAESEASGKAAVPTPKRPRLTLTDDERAALSAQVLKSDKSLPADLASRVTASSRTRMAELLTSNEWLERETERNAAREADENAALERREAKAAEKAARGGMTKGAWNKAQKAAAAAAAAAEAAAAAAAAPPPPPPVPTPPAAAPKKAARQPPPAVPAGNMYAKAYAIARGTKRTRGDS